jgi:hypothetical protein
MKKFGLGTILVIIGGILAIILQMMGIPKSWGAGIGIAVSAIGFSLQMFSALNMRNKFERELRAKKAEDGRFMDEISQLPPEQAIARLLK